MLVKEVKPGVFEIWNGTPGMPSCMEFFLSSEDLRAYDFYVPLPEDTLAPSYLHEMGDVHTIRDENGLVRRVVEWVPIVDLETAREIIHMELDLETAGRPELESLMATYHQQISDAMSIDALVALELKIPPEGRILETPTGVVTV